MCEGAHLSSGLQQEGGVVPLGERGEAPSPAGRLGTGVHMPPAARHLREVGEQVPRGAAVRRALAGRGGERGRLGGRGVGGGGRPAGCGGDVGADAAAADAGAGCPVGSAAVVVVMVGAGVGVGVGGWGCGCGSWGEGLHVDLRVWLGRGVVGLRARVVLGAQLHGGAHGDLRLLGEAVAAVGRRHAAKRARRRAVAAAVRAVHVGLGLDLDNPVGTRTVGRETINTYI